VRKTLRESHVDEPLDLVRAQQRDEVLGRLPRVPDGEDARHRR